MQRNLYLLFLLLNLQVPTNILGADTDTQALLPNSYNGTAITPNTIGSFPFVIPLTPELIQSEFTYTELNLPCNNKKLPTIKELLPAIVFTLLPYLTQHKSDHPNNSFFTRAYTWGASHEIWKDQTYLSLIAGYYNNLVKGKTPSEQEINIFAECLNRKNEKDELITEGLDALPEIFQHTSSFFFYLIILEAMKNNPKKFHNIYLPEHRLYTLDPDHTHDQNSLVFVEKIEDAHPIKDALRHFIPTNQFLPLLNLITQVGLWNFDHITVRDDRSSNWSNVKWILNQLEQPCNTPAQCAFNQNPPNEKLIPFSAAARNLNDPHTKYCHNILQGIKSLISQVPETNFKHYLPIIAFWIQTNEIINGQDFNTAKRTAIYNIEQLIPYILEH